MADKSIAAEQNSRADPDDVRLNRRDVDEFLGLCRSACADGEISQAELDLLGSWIAKSSRIESMPLVSQVRDLIADLNRDASATARATLLQVLQQLTGTVHHDGRATPTSLAFTDPAPELEFAGKRYCFTGDFDFGTRTACENAVLRRGGLIKKKITLNTDVLVVGSSATDSWLHSSYGLKISTAVRWRENGVVDIPVVSEEHWLQAISQCAPTRALTGDDLETRDDPFEMAMDLAEHGEISRDRFAEIWGDMPFPGREDANSRQRAHSAQEYPSAKNRPEPSVTFKPSKHGFAWWLVAAFLASFYLAYYSLKTDASATRADTEHSGFSGVDR
jgi:hypothetical protein